MTKRFTFLFSFLFIFVFGFSQEEKIIHGKIIIKDATPMGVHIINLVNEKEAISNEKGEFIILAKPDDVLVFASDHLDYQRKIIEITDYKAAFINIAMTSKINQLDEVEINYPVINALDLGILSKPAKKYTPAERRLYTSQSTVFDALLNNLSGRTKMLERGIAIEKKEFVLKKLEDLYDETFYTERLKINKEFIKGFRYYAVENQKLNEAINTNNNFLITFLLIGLAENYNELFTNEKQ